MTGMSYSLEKQRRFATVGSCFPVNAARKSRAVFYTKDPTSQTLAPGFLTSSAIDKTEVVVLT
jgi:hypothetical protein